jgi:hypothetical protein
MAKRGKPAAVIAKPEAETLSEEERRQVMERFREAIERIGERNADKDPDEVMRIVTEVVEEVRQEHYEREQRAAEGRR